MKLKTSSACFSAVGMMAVSSSSPWIAAEAFVVHPQAVARRSPTSLNLEDRIADMIDGEVHRLDNKHISEAEFLLKQQKWSRMEPTLPSNFDLEDDFDQPLAATGGPIPGFTSGVDRSISSPRRRKDEKMAQDDPMRYCADRCVTTGNCDVFEDMFDLDPSEVVKFCKECVLSEDEEPCDVPESFFGDFDDSNDFGGLNPAPTSALHP